MGAVKQDLRFGRNLILLPCEERNDCVSHAGTASSGVWWCKVSPATSVGSHACSRLSASGGPARGVPVMGLQLEPDTDWNMALDGTGCVVHCAAGLDMLRDVSAGQAWEFNWISAGGNANRAMQAAQCGARRSNFTNSIGLSGSETAVTPFAAEETPVPHSPHVQSMFELGLALCKPGDESGMEVVIIRPQLTDDAGAPGSSTGVSRAVRRGIPLPRSGVDRLGSHFALDKLVDLIATVPGTHWRGTRH